MEKAGSVCDVSYVRKRRLIDTLRLCMHNFVLLFHILQTSSTQCYSYFVQNTKHTLYKIFLLFFSRFFFYFFLTFLTQLMMFQTVINFPRPDTEQKELAQFFLFFFYIVVPPSLGILPKLKICSSQPLYTTLISKTRNAQSYSSFFQTIHLTLFG